MREPPSLDGLRKVAGLPRGGRRSTTPPRAARPAVAGFEFGRPVAEAAEAEAPPPPAARAGLDAPTARPRKPSASAGLGAAAEGGAAAYSAREDVLRRIQASVRGREKEIGGSGGALVEPPRPLGEF